MVSSTPLEVPRTTHILILKMIAFGLHLLMFCLGLQAVWGNGNMIRDVNRNIPNMTKTFDLGDGINVSVEMEFNCFRCNPAGPRVDRNGDLQIMHIVGFTFVMVSSMLFALGSLLSLTCSYGLQYFFARKCDRVLLNICGVLMLLNCILLLHPPVQDCKFKKIDLVSECRRSYRFSENFVSTLFGFVSAIFYFAAAVCACQLKTPDWMIMADQGIPPEEASKYRIVPDSEAAMRSQVTPAPSQPLRPQPSQRQMPPPPAAAAAAPQIN